MATKIKLRGDTAARLADLNPLLSTREFCVETDTLNGKIGNGVEHYVDLPYAFGPGITYGWQTLVKFFTTDAEQDYTVSGLVGKSELGLIQYGTGFLTSDQYTWTPGTNAFHLTIATDQIVAGTEIRIQAR